MEQSWGIILGHTAPSYAPRGWQHKVLRCPSLTLLSRVGLRRIFGVSPAANCIHRTGPYALKLMEVSFSVDRIHYQRSSGRIVRIMGV